VTQRDIIARLRASIREQAAALPVDSLRNGSVNRRTFLLGTTASGVAFTRSAGATQVASPAASPVADPASRDNLFSLGVASGDPWPDGVVLWTRLAPQPFAPDGGMGTAPVDVEWEVASDEAMTTIVQRGTVMAEAAWAHSVHVEVTGLDPATWYWYRFRAGGTETEIGRTRTAPAADSAVDRLRFAFASCQRWDVGLYTAYRDMATQDIDLVVHLGDYIYESQHSSRDFLREGDFPVSALLEVRNLESYRARYALYKLDPDLQAAHLRAPWIVTWDDHEVNNNVFGILNRDEPAAQMLLERRAAAYQAYYEHQPLRAAAKPKGPDLQLYRRLGFGNLLEFNVLDTRQYRSPQGNLCDDIDRAGNGGYCPDSLDPDRTMLGDAQKRWLFDGVSQATATWNVLAQQVPFARVDNDAFPDAQSFGGKEMDKWDGYAVERDEVARTIAGAAKAGSFNPVVLTGDVHRNYVWDLKTDWDDPSNTTVFGAEFVGTSLTSNGDEPLEEDGKFTTVCGEWNGNPHNHLYDNHRGYVLCEVTPDRWTADYRVLSSVTHQDATVDTLASFVVEDSYPGVEAGSTCRTDLTGSPT
jgi:alkaline phosphatase D